MTTDLTFITNQPYSTLLDRFKVLIKNNTKYFDCLVGYFYTSGFNKLHDALKEVDSIRILVGVNTNKEIYDLSQSSTNQLELNFSHSQAKEKFTNEILEEMEESEDNSSVEEGIRKFVEWLNNGKSNDPNKKPKLQIRVYPSQKLHAKLYIMTFAEGDRDIGRVITGSSNFTQSGLVENLEFNVELKNRADYDFAKQKFEELWENAVDVSQKYIETIKTRTWLKEDITPYELYLKSLYEYFKDELTTTDEVFTKYLPADFKKFEYQEQAVINAKKILEEYGGVFISDVVGLGKTYITAMLAAQLDGRTIVIAPPALITTNNPGAWQNVFSDFCISADYVSTGNLKKAQDLIKKREYKNIIIDEAHKFRTETAANYETLAEICRGKRVILVSATPYNNSPQDVLSQIKLFQSARKSTIPGMRDIETFFKNMDTKLKKINRTQNYDEYLKTVKHISKEIREKVLKYLMVRRTRIEIEKYFSKDLKKNHIKFPEIEDPKPLYYQLNDKEDEIFTKTIDLITKKFLYARYTPLLYLKQPLSGFEAQQQRNMGGFMKVLLVKRLESSFYAFKNTINRFIASYNFFIKEYEKGHVYTSKNYINKIIELLENEDDEAVQKLIDEGKTERYNSVDFTPDFEKNLKQDLEILENIKTMWESVTRDPKIESLLKELKESSLLKKNKIIIFTESKETAEYLTKEIKKHLGDIVLLFHSQSSEITRDKVIENFDAKATNKKDDYRILISTEVLSEGVNLHRSNIIINYDIPWNPTRLMQRVGRINRVDTPFSKIYTFNFFPTKQSESEIELTKIARSKIEAFFTLLGGDSAILTEGEPVGSHELFDRLLSKKSITGDEEEESELKYLRIIEEIRDNNPELFEKIKHLPKKARSAKLISTSLEETAKTNSLLTFFRKNKLIKFFLANAEDKSPIELDFLTSAKILECSPSEKRQNIPTNNYYELLDKNKTAFSDATTEEIIEIKKKGGSNTTNKLLKILKLTQKNSLILTEEQKEYLRLFLTRLEESAIPKRTEQRALKSLQNLKEEIQNPLKVLSVLQSEVSPQLLSGYLVESHTSIQAKREIILSMYLTGEHNG